MNQCELCGSASIREKRVKDYAYQTPMGLVTIDGDSVFEECEKCGETLISGNLINEWNNLILKTLSIKRGLFSKQELQFIFSVLPYSQNDLAKATGRERSTLTRYKTGENPIDLLFADELQQIIRDHISGNETTIQRLRDRTQFRFEDEAIRRLKVR